MGQADKNGPKGASVEADIRKNVLNAKIEAVNSGHIQQLESLESGRATKPPHGTYFSALEVEKMPREFTYVSTEPAAGGGTRTFRTIIMMEQSVDSAGSPGTARRPDLLIMKYEMDPEEIKQVAKGKSFAQANAGRPHIITKCIEIRSIDFNTPLSLNRAEAHFKKHVDTAYSAVKDLAERHRIFPAKDGAVVNVIVKEWYHKTTGWWDKEVKTRMSNAKLRGLAFFESHTAVFSMESNGGRLKASAPKFESIFRDKTRDPKNPRRWKFLTSRDILKLSGKDVPGSPTKGLPEKLRRFSEEMKGLKKMLPTLLRVK